MSDNQSDTLDFLNRIAGNRSFAEQEQQQRERTAPTVTPGAGSGARPSSLMDSLRSQLGNSYQQQSPRDNFNDQLTNFGLSLMTSRNPRFLGAVGEAVGAQRDAARQRNTEMRQLLESESQATYREGQLSVAQAEQRLREATQRYAQDPTNPANRLAVAQAEQAAAHARYYEKSAAHVGERQPNWTLMVDKDTGQYVQLDSNTGRTRPIQAGLQPSSTTANSPIDITKAIEAQGIPNIPDGTAVVPMLDRAGRPSFQNLNIPYASLPGVTTRQQAGSTRYLTGMYRTIDAQMRILGEQKDMAGQPRFSPEQLEAERRRIARNYLTDHPPPPGTMSAPAEPDSTTPAAGPRTTTINMGARP
jgi:hypothetical protein